MEFTLGYVNCLPYHCQQSPLKNTNFMEIIQISIEIFHINKFVEQHICC